MVAGRCWAISPPDAHIITLLRNAGAVLMGKATLSEWADLRSNNHEYVSRLISIITSTHTYLAELSNTNIRSLKDIVQYNIGNLSSEGGFSVMHPAFGSG